MSRNQGGFGSAGSSRSLRTTHSAVGRGSTARERDRRATAHIGDAKLTDPPIEAIRESIATGQCCWCDDPRTFKWIAQHLVRGHGFDLDQLRDLLLLPKRTPFASQEIRDEARRRAIARDAITKCQAAPRSGVPHKLNAYGRASQREKMALGHTPAALAKHRQTMQDRYTQEQRVAWASKASRAVSTAARSKAGKLGGQIRAAQMTPEVRAQMIAKRESNAEYRAARLTRFMAIRDPSAGGRATAPKGKA